MTGRFRIAHLIVQPVLVWDDGEELSPGPPLSPVTVPLSHLGVLAEMLPGQVADLAAKLSEDTA